MDEKETVLKLCRKEMRKQKLMEYLTAKGKLKPVNPKPYLPDLPAKKTAMSTIKPVMGKENQPPNPVLKNKGTKVQVPISKAIQRSTGIVHGVINQQSSQRGSILSLTQRANCPVSASAQCKKTTYTIASLKEKLSATNQPLKLPNPLMKHATRPGSVKSLSNPDSLSVSQTVRQPNRVTSAAKSGPRARDSVRMSLAPVVKTKTGLIHSVAQPRQKPSTRTTGQIAPPVTAMTAGSIRASSTSAPSAAVSKNIYVAQRKANPNMASNKPFQSRKAATGFKYQPQIKANTKPATIKPNEHQSRSSVTQQPAHVSVRGATASAKPNGVMQERNAVKSVQPTKTAGAAYARPTRPGSRVSTTTRIQDDSREASRPAAAAPLGAKGKIPAQKDKKNTRVSVSLAATKTTGVPLAPKTLPRCANRSGALREWNTEKTPRAHGSRPATARPAPQTEVKKPTAAQKERMKKLQEWREAKGISYKRPPMPMRPQVRHTMALPKPYWAAMEEEDEAQSIVCAMDRTLEDCIKLLGEGCSQEDVAGILLHLPLVAKKFAKYWICQARLMEQQGNLDVLPLFEDAVRVVLEPVDELRKVVFDILKKRDELQHTEELTEEESETPAGNFPAGQDPLATPRPVRGLIKGDMGESSLVKYKITATPGGVRSHKREPLRVNGQEVRFFTPVRRSVRIESSAPRYPASLQEHDLCVASYSDLLAEEEGVAGGEPPDAALDTPMYVYRENEALKDQVKVKLIYGDD